MLEHRTYRIGQTISIFESRTIDNACHRNSDVADSTALALSILVISISPVHLSTRKAYRRRESPLSNLHSRHNICTLEWTGRGLRVQMFKSTTYWCCWYFPLCRLEAYTRTITVACEDLEFWLERPRGYPLLVVKNLHENGTTAYPQGLRNGDIVVAINDRRAWELNIGEALLLLLGPIGENAHGTVDVTWMPRAQSAFALRIVHEIREEGQRRSGGLPADPTRSTGGGAESSIEVHRRRNIHEVMSPAQVERHRQRNVRANMSQEQAERHRQLNSQGQMTPEQIERQRGRNRHTNMTNDQIANHQRRANLLILPRDGALQLNYGTRCPHCGFRYLQHETNKDLCCGRGKATRVPFPELNPLPANIRRLATNYPQHFAEQSFQYNNLLAFAAIGVDNGDPSSSGFRRPAGGPHCIKIHGRTYHRVATASGQRNAVRYKSNLVSCN